MSMFPSVGQILLNLSSKDDTTRRQAENKILEFAQENLPILLQSMLNILWQDPDHDSGTAPMYTNVRIGLRLLGDPARDALLEAMRQRNHTALAAGTLHHWRTDPLVRDGWIELARDGTANVKARMNAIYGLGVYPHPDSIEHILALTDDPTPAIAVTASRQFFGYKDPELQLELYSRWQLRENLSPKQRAAVACGLIGNHPLGNREIFEQVLADPDPWVRQELAYRLRTLEWFHKWAHPIHLRLLRDDPSVVVRHFALGHLCLSAKPEELDDFLAALKQETEVNSLAQMYYVQAFQKMGTKAAAALKAKNPPPNPLWGAVVRAMGLR